METLENTNGAVTEIDLRWLLGHVPMSPSGYAPKHGKVEQISFPSCIFGEDRINAPRTSAPPYKGLPDRCPEQTPSRTNAPLGHHFWEYGSEESQRSIALAIYAYADSFENVNNKNL